MEDTRHSDLQDFDSKLLAIVQGQKELGSQFVLGDIFDNLDIESRDDEALDCHHDISCGVLLGFDRFGFGHFNLLG